VPPARFSSVLDFHPLGIEAVAALDLLAGRDAGVRREPHGLTTLKVIRQLSPSPSKRRTASEPPGLQWRLWEVLSEAGDRTVVVVLVLDGRDVAAGAVERRWLNQSTYSG
jgi:hypothetical protein